MEWVKWGAEKGEWEKGEWEIGEVENWRGGDSAHFEIVEERETTIASRSLAVPTILSDYGQALR